MYYNKISYIVLVIYSMCFTIDHLNNLYYIMSGGKHQNAKTSILGRQYTLAVTFDGSFLCLNVSFCVI